MSTKQGGEDVDNNIQRKTPPHRSDAHNAEIVAQVQEQQGGGDAATLLACQPQDQHQREPGPPKQHGEALDGPYCC